jgi:DNA-binding NarL/FixJ family response regulator
VDQSRIYINTPKSDNALTLEVVDAKHALTLLDLNIPKIDGKQVLKKTRQTLIKYTCIVLATSKIEEDIAGAYELGCNSFLIKPVEVDKFIEIPRELGSSCLKLVVVPPKEDKAWIGK